jgi:putative endonuclease
MVGCYIIFSKALDRYYVGYTQEPFIERLRKHNEHSYGMHRFTSAANDWEEFLFIECRDATQAIRVEKHIKKMKSRKYIENLKKYPEIIVKLKAI